MNTLNELRSMKNSRNCKTAFLQSKFEERIMNNSEEVEDQISKRDK